jgi:hypothetical protein
MAKINARSPYYISTGTVNSLTSTTLDLYIYTGTQSTDRPSSPTYSLQSFAVQNISVVEISELVKDYFQNSFSGIYQSDNYWVDYRTTNFINGVAQTPSGFTGLTGFYGYGYFDEAENPQNDSSLLQSNKTIVKLDDAPVNLAVDTSNTSNVAFYSDNQLIYNKSISSSTQNNLQIEYVTNTVNGSDVFEDRVVQDGGTFEGNKCLTEFSNEFEIFPVDTIYVDGVDGVDLIKVKNIEECKYQPYKVTFINKYGALQDVWFFKRTNETLTTKKEEFKRNIIVNGAYNISNHQNKILTKNGSEKLTLNTGFYPEEYNEVFKQMQLSEDCWIEVNNKTLPINISSSELAYKTHLNDKLINYTISIDYAFDVINNIR